MRRRTAGHHWPRQAGTQGTGLPRLRSWDGTAQAEADLRYTIRRGKILRVDMFFLADKDSVSETIRSLAGSEAVGLSEQDAHADS